MTVSVAYDQLTGEGYLRSRVGDGTFVSEHASSILRDTVASLGESTRKPRT